MQQTANYNLNLPEGTDVVNPLVDYNPNFSTIDSAMKANADRTVGRATCIKSGTTHVVTRANTGSNIINFTATGDWNTGDTMTIDSTIVSVFLPDGTAALDGAYVINAEVFGILNGTRFTLYGSQKLPGYTALDISYDNTGSGLTASDVQVAIDEIVANMNTPKNTLGNGVNIISATLANPYVCPSDGYVQVSTAANTGDYIITKVRSANDENAITTVDRCTSTAIGAYNVITVHKGMRVSFTTNGTCYASFISIS